jgi:NAD(P)-dependent dehydrogenase (short-subunit alcohol dehydrogenase family)
MKTQDTIALVTGANRGIGRAFVEAYLAHGAKKVYAAARKRTDLDAIVALDPKRVVPIVLDVSKPAEVAAAAATAKDVNVLINNAGVLSFGNVLEASEETLPRDLDINYFGTIRVTRAFAPMIEKNGGGVVANLLSVVSLASMPGVAGYNASKAALWSATQSMRADLAKRDIRVVGVFPGPIDTDMAKDFPMAKTPAIDVANDVLNGIANGAEDIFPDPMAKQVYAAWSKDHKAVEKQFAGA